MHINEIRIYPDRFPNRDHYPFNLSIFQNSGTLDINRGVTVFSGENGTGKSTLLRAIARKCGIYIWEDSMRVRYESNPYQNLLYRALEVEWADGPVPGSYFGSEIFQHFSHVLDAWAQADAGILEYFGGKSLTSQSHGQSILAYFKSRYEVRGIYFMDEPETALSPASQVKLISLMHEMSRKGHAQFVMATHSPLLMAFPGACIYSFDDDVIRTVDFHETEYYHIYKRFFKDPRGFFRESLELNNNTKKI